MRALLSVSDKTGIVEFAKELEALGVEIISTGGTHKKLEEAGVKVTGISDVTGFPECLDGRVKTLHPAVHAGLLARRDLPEHMDQLKELGIETIDIVAINLYPFKATIMKPDVTLEDAIRKHRYRRTDNAEIFGKEPQGRNSRLRSGRLWHGHRSPEETAAQHMSRDTSWLSRYSRQQQHTMQ